MLEEIGSEEDEECEHVQASTSAAAAGSAVPAKRKGEDDDAEENRVEKSVSLGIRGCNIVVRV